MLNEAQEQAHYSGIGGSMAPAIAGVDEYSTPLDAYMQLTDEEYRRDKQREIGEKESVLFGNLLEEPIANEVSRRLGLRLVSPEETIRHGVYRWMVGNPDRLVVGKRAGVEIKNRSYHMAGKYEEGPLAKEIIQCQHYMAVMDYDLFHLGVLLGGNELRLFKIRRDDSLISELIELEREFWEGHVLAERPPAPDFEHPATVSLMDRLYPVVSGGAVDLPEGAQYWHQVLQDATKRRKDYDDVARVAKLHLQEMVGENAEGRLPGGGVYRRKQVERKGYTVETKKYIDFRYVK